MTLKASSTEEQSLLDYDSLEIARQITLSTFETYSKIKVTELFNQSWTKRELQHRSPNVLKMIAQFNHLASLVATLIVSEKVLKKRAHVMETFIRIADCLREVKNFQALMSVVSGLNNCAVQRLKWTHAKLSKKSLQVRFFSFCYKIFFFEYAHMFADGKKIFFSKDNRKSRKNMQHGEFIQDPSAANVWCFAAMCSIHV